MDFDALYIYANISAETLVLECLGQVYTYILGTKTSYVRFQ